MGSPLAGAVGWRVLDLGGWMDGVGSLYLAMVPLK